MPLVTTLAVGGLQTNCYILKTDDSDDCAVIDPGGEPARVVEAVSSAGLNLKYILCTHGHPDHTGGVSLLQQELGGMFYLVSTDTVYSDDPPVWLLGALGTFTAPPEPDSTLEDSASITLGSGEIMFLSTPGHTPGSTCFLFEEMVFTGDTLFKDSIGRYDLPGGDGKQEIESIRDRLLVLPDETIVYPGHGESSTIGRERASNPFLSDLR